MALAPSLAQALVYRHPQRFAVWHRTRPLFRDALPSGVRARWQLGWARFWSGMSIERSLWPARAAAELFRADGHVAGNTARWRSLPSSHQAKCLTMLHRL